MLSLAARMLRHRIGSALATLIALATGVMILMSMGVLVESGLRYRPTPQRYAAADVVVAHRDITFTGKDLDGDTTSTTVVLPEGGTVPVTLVGQLRAGTGSAASPRRTTSPASPPRCSSPTPGPRRSLRSRAASLPSGSSPRPAPTGPR